MTPLEAAKALATADFTEVGTGWCIFCSVRLYKPGDQHNPNCLVLALPQIVAALEAAEALVDAFDCGVGKAALNDRVNVLVAALKE